MNGLLIIILSLAAVMHASAECIDYSPHPNGQCNAFIRCHGNTPYIMTCNAPTLFNPVYSVCDWPQNVKCPTPPQESTPAPKDTTPAAQINITAAPTETTAAPTETTAAPVETTTAPKITTMVWSTTEGPNYPPCPASLPAIGKFPDISSGCEAYFVCEKGVVTKQHCPPGLLYDVWTQYCQIATLVKSCSFSF